MAPGHVGSVHVRRLPESTLDLRDPRRSSTFEENPPSCSRRPVYESPFPTPLPMPDGPGDPAPSLWLIMEDDPPPPPRCPPSGGGGRGPGARWRGQPAGGGPPDRPQGPGLPAPHRRRGRGPPPPPPHPGVRAGRLLSQRVADRICGWSTIPIVVLKQPIWIHSSPRPTPPPPVVGPRRRSSWRTSSPSTPSAAPPTAAPISCPPALAPR